MKVGITRRTFVAGSAAVGALAGLGCAPAPANKKSGSSKLAVASGPDIEKNTRAVVDAFGGMGEFVKKGQTVGILVNVLGAIPAAHTKPEVIRTVVGLCRDADAQEVRIMDWRNIERWEQNKLLDVVKELDLNFQHVDVDNPDLWRSVDIPRGKAIQKVRIFNALYEPDVFICLPLMKNHGGTDFTGALKLYMGTTHPGDNRAIFHRERGAYLEQCIADLNTVVRPADLVIMDAMEVITTRGPVGPGQTVSPQKMVAGVDRVALDAFCSPLIGYDPARSTQIRSAYEHGVGEMDMENVAVEEVSVA